MDKFSVSNKGNKNSAVIKLEETIGASLYWHSPVGCQILDLKECHYDDVLRLIKRHFFPEDPMCRAINILADSVSTQSYLDSIQLWMKDTTSLVAVSSKSGRVVGTIITRINSSLERSNTYSRIQIFQGEAVEKIMHLNNTLIKQADAYRQLETDIYLRIYILCVHPSYLSIGLKSGLLEAFIQMAIALEIPAIGGIFSSSGNQKLADDLGFKLLSEILYSRWSLNDKIIFDNPGSGNYSVEFMAMKTPSDDYLNNIWQARENIINEEKARRKNHHRHINY